MNLYASAAIAAASVVSTIYLGIAMFGVVPFLTFYTGCVGIILTATAAQFIILKYF